MKMMKFMAMMVAAVTLSMGATSCDNDDDDVKPVPAAEAAAGTYTGDLSITVMGEESSYANAVYEIKAIDENTISLTTPAVGEGMMALPAITLEGLTVSQTAQNGVEAIVASKDEITGTIGEKSYTITGLTIAIVPTMKTAGITYSLKYGKMPMAMVANYKGVKK